MSLVSQALKPHFKDKIEMSELKLRPTKQERTAPPWPYRRKNAGVRTAALCP